jgi:hypothetical protein
MGVYAGKPGGYGHLTSIGGPFGVERMPARAWTHCGDLHLARPAVRAAAAPSDPGARRVSR